MIGSRQALRQKLKQRFRRETLNAQVELEGVLDITVAVFLREIITTGLKLDGIGTVQVIADNETEVRNANGLPTYVPTRMHCIFTPDPKVLVELKSKETLRNRDTVMYENLRTCIRAYRDLQKLDNKTHIKKG